MNSNSFAQCFVSKVFSLKSSDSCAIFKALIAGRSQTGQNGGLMEIECPGQAAEIYNKLKTKLEDYRKQGKLQQLKDINFNDAAHEAVASGTGFKSKIQCRDGKVVVDLDLGLFLKPMRSQIEDGIRKTLAKVFA